LPAVNRSFPQKYFSGILLVLRKTGSNPAISPQLVFNKESTANRKLPTVNCSFRKRSRSFPAIGFLIKSQLQIGNYKLQFPEAIPQFSAIPKIAHCAKSAQFFTAHY